MDLSHELLTAAVEAGLCEEHTRLWNKETVFDLIEYYKANPDWCLERRYPTLGFMKRNFDTDAVQKQGVFIDQHNLDIRLFTPNGAPVFVFNNCSGVIHISGWQVARIYVSLDSNITINVEDNAMLILDYYNDSKVGINNRSNGGVIVYQFGNMVPITKGKPIKIAKKYGGHQTM